MAASMTSLCYFTRSSLMLQLFANMSRTGLNTSQEGTDSSSSTADSEMTSTTPSLQWYYIVIPIICICGVIGNILNLIVLTRRRLLSRMDELEKCATYGLLALAFSDMMFCVAVLPQTLINEEKIAVTVNEVYHLYYKLYGVALINLFLMNSTWLIVYMAINRYIVVVYPFQARWALGTKQTIAFVIAVYTFAVLLTSPFFFHVVVKECWTLDGKPMYEYASPWSDDTESYINSYMKWIWPIVADFIPLGLLSILNVRLIYELRRARLRRRSTCRGQTIQDSSHRVTLTLVIIVLMLLMLVTPSEILRYVNPFDSWGETGHIIASITNMFQILNFALNFILYCVVSGSYRQTLASLVSCCEKKNEEFIEMQSTLTTINSTKKRSPPLDRPYTALK